MYHVILCCEWGASTSLLVEKLRKTASDQNLEIEISAISIRDLDNHIQSSPCNMIMLGPQIAYKFKTLQNRYANSNIKLTKIPPEDYAMLNSESVMALIEREMKK